MRIKSLTVHGFKSFADRTKLDLHDGITAIVGPNGCGKSNISDAIRWVLGEQRPTAIRGSRMEEAIFGGTEQRRAIHRAEVTLELSNEDGTLPLPFAEVSVGRTVYRGGESEYSLNGAPCRLKDILDLCRDTGLGANAYSVIESRMIDAILSDRAEERRALFEEAAEIGRYKDRRRIALRRLEQAEADLQRLEDVLVEVQSKVRSLAQQRGRAERHTRLRARLLDLDVAVADARLESTEARLRAAGAELAGLEQTRVSEQTDLQTAETEAETMRLEQAELERERSILARKVDDLRALLEARERERLIAEERGRAAAQRLEALALEAEDNRHRRDAVSQQAAAARAALEEAEARHAALSADEQPLRAEFESLEQAELAGREELDEARGRLDEATRELARFDAEFETAAERAEARGLEIDERRAALEELDGQESELRSLIEQLESREAEAMQSVRDLDARHEAAAARIAELDQRLSEARAEAMRVEGQRDAARARVSSLSGLLESAAGQPATVTQLLAAGIPGVRGPLSDAIEASAGVAAAVEAHLGPYLHGVVVDDFAAIEAARSWLSGQPDGGGLLLLPVDPGPRESGGSAGDLLEQVALSGPGAEWAQALLGGVELREDGPWSAGSRAWIGAGGRQDPWGAIHLAPAGADGVLTRRAELEAARASAAELDEALTAAVARVNAVEAEHQDSRSAHDRVDSERRRAHLQLRDLQAEQRSAEGRAARIGREREALTGRLDQLEMFRASALELTHSGATQRETLEEAVSGAERALSEVREAAYAARREADETRAALHALELELTRAEAERSARAGAVDRASASLEELEQRAAAIEREQIAQREVQKDSAAVSATAETEVASRIEERGERERELAALEARIAERRESLDQRERALKEARRAEREHAEARHKLELETTELRAVRDGVHERLGVEWDSTLDELRERATPIENGDLESWQAELDNVRRSLARIGPVNLLAQEEYDEQKERLDFLTAQRDDLTSARGDLKDSIRRINRSAAEAFHATFEEIRRNFQTTFEALFQGGECDVWLEDPDDPLDSPIEISASPRGKRTQRIHLLSGGERALTALSLVFGIYLTKPSPFCLMDEVDAPLDESNVLRFVKLLQDFKSDTQFLVITHNPRTIEGADWVYGVTMQEPGVSSMVGVTFDPTTQVA